MSRRFSLESLHYIAVAARMMSWGVDVADVKAMIGDDKPMRAGSLRLRPHSFIEHIWRQLDDPEKREGVEVLVLWRVVHPETRQTLHYSHDFTSAKSLASAVRTGIDGIFISMKELANQVDGVERE
jgi:hypothetical protein